jgi:uncharacterized protein (DUF2267 family)
MIAMSDLSATVRATEDWIDDLMRRLGWHDRERVYLALIATLHALRDCLARDEAVYVGAHLPPLLRGLYSEGWHPGGRPAARSRGAFLERIHDGVHRDPGVDAEQVARPYFLLAVCRWRAEDAGPPRQPLHNL